jgi:CheY-like chemotaxis protein
MDIKMPGMDGYQATRELLNIQPGLTIVAQTAHAITGVRERVLEAGCVGYISKPIRREELYQSLEQVFRS